MLLPVLMFAQSAVCIIVLKFQTYDYVTHETRS